LVSKLAGSYQGVTIVRLERALDLKTPRGAFVAWMLSSKTAREMFDWASYMGVQNVVPPEEMHATIIYAPESPLDSDLHGTRPLQMPIELSHLNRPKTRVFGEAGSAGCLVTTYDSDQLAARHRFFRDTFNLIPTFPTFVPHITLSYDAHSQRPEVMRILMSSPCGMPITLDRERIAFPHS
jgi:2'-5' RNA ligase